MVALRCGPILKIDQNGRSSEAITQAVGIAGAGCMLVDQTMFRTDAMRVRLFSGPFHA